MTRTTSGNSGGGTFRIDNTIREIGLTERGIIVATSEWRVCDWLCDYVRPYENNRYALRYAETERDFETLVKKSRMAMAFIETDFFEEKTVACLERIRKGNPRLRVILFAVTALKPDDTSRYLWRGAGSFISLREWPELVRGQMKSIFDGYDRISEKNLNEMREYNRLLGIPPHLTVQEVEVCRYAAQEKERKEIAVYLGISVRTVDNHLLNIRQKFRKQNMVGILRIAVSLGILSPEELLCRDFEYSAFPLTDHTC
jgi:DNA-binding CsgD family transcriptional regulator